VSLVEIAPGVHLVSLGVVNAYLIDGDELALIDTGTPASTSTERIVAAVRDLGREPSDIRHILVTHSHPDHAGGLAALKRLSGAAAYMHPLAAAVVRGDETGRPLRATPGLLNRIICRTFIPRPPWNIPLALVEHEILDGDIIPVGGGIRAIHAPGHSSGQLAFHIMRAGGGRGDQYDQAGSDAVLREPGDGPPQPGEAGRLSLRSSWVRARRADPTRRRGALPREMGRRQPRFAAARSPRFAETSEVLGPTPIPHRG
jgi:glyoxylase-like metal-dependent hydrolase (beta-lactamase superfamily II)